MRTVVSSLVIAGSLLLAGSPAFAQAAITGTVYQTAPNGVYLQNPNGVTFVPSASARFRIGNTPVTLSAMGVGTPVQAYCLPSYQPQYVPVAYYRQHPRWEWRRHVESWRRDRYAWNERERRHGRYEAREYRHHY